VRSQRIDLSQAREVMRTGFKSDEDERSVGAVRRSSTHLGREDPNRGWEAGGWKLCRARSAPRRRLRQRAEERNGRNARQTKYHASFRDVAESERKLWLAMSQAFS